MFNVEHSLGKTEDDDDDDSRISFVFKFPIWNSDKFLRFKSVHPSKIAPPPGTPLQQIQFSRFTVFCYLFLYIALFLLLAIWLFTQHVKHILI